MNRKEIKEATEKAQEEFLKNYFKKTNFEEAGKRNYVCIGEKNGNFYFIRPKKVMSKKSMCDPYKEKDGFSYFAFNLENEKMTQGSQCAFVDSTKLGLNGIPTFDLDFISTKLIKFEQNCSLENLLIHKSFEGFAKSAKDMLHNTAKEII